MLEFIELRWGKERELGLVEGAGLVDIGCATRGEDGALVTGIAIDSWEVDETTGVEEVKGKVLDEVVIKGGIIGEQGICMRARKRVVDVLLLQIVDLEGAEAGKCVGLLGASCTAHEVVVLVLRFANIADSAAEA